MKSVLLNNFYGNQKAKQTLVNFITDGRLSHAILLEGEDGCGKTEFARIMAASQLCSDKTEDLEKPCGLCRNCRLIMRDAHPDVQIFGTDDRTSGFHIEEIREIRASAYVLPNDGDKKFYILKNVQNLTQQAQNAMLKIIEEPPPNVCFLLTCNNRTRLLPTIISRVQVINLTSCTTAQCLEALAKHSPETPLTKLKTAAARADGNIGRALDLLQDENLFAIDTQAMKAAEILCVGEEFAALCLFQPYTGAKKREDLLKFLASIREYFIEVLRQKSGSAITKFAEGEGKIPNIILNRVTAIQAMKILDLVQKSSEQIRQNINLSLAAAAFCAAAKDILD